MIIIIFINITTCQSSEVNLHTPLTNEVPQLSPLQKVSITNNISSTLLSTYVKEQHLEEAHGPSEMHSSLDYKAVSLEKKKHSLKMKKEEEKKKKKGNPKMTMY